MIFLKPARLVIQAGNPDNINDLIQSVCSSKHFFVLKTIFNSKIPSMNFRKSLLLTVFSMALLCKAQTREFTYNGNPISPKALFKLWSGDSIVELKDYLYDSKTSKSLNWYTQSQKDSFYRLEILVTDDGSAYPHYVDLAYKVWGYTPHGKFIVLWKCIAGTNQNYNLVMILDLKQGNLIHVGDIDYDYKLPLAIMGNQIVNGSRHYLIPDWSYRLHN